MAEGGPPEGDIDRPPSRFTIRRPKLSPRHDVSSRPATPSRRANSPDILGPPRIPSSTNHASPTKSSRRRRSSENLKAPLITPDRTRNKTLRLVSSTSSLLTQDSQETPTKKRKRLLPFRKNFVGAWKETTSDTRDGPDKRPEANPATVSSQNDHLVSQLSTDFATLPADLKPAAAKRLGIEHDVVGLDGKPLMEYSSNTKPSSPNRSQISSVTLVNQCQKSGGNGQNRLRERPGAPDHNLQPLHAHDFDVPVEETFFLSSSDSEEDDEDQRSRVSCRSSHTSYTVTTPADVDNKDFREQFRDVSQGLPVAGQSPAKSRYSGSTHSARSSGNSQFSGISSPPRSRPNSFSRPFNRPFSARTSSLSSSADKLSSGAERNSQSQLSAIREDSPIPPVDSPETPSNISPQEYSTNSTLNQLSNSNTSPPIPSMGQTMSSNIQSHPPLHASGPQQELSTHPIGNGQRLAGSVTEHRSARPLSLAITKDSKASLSSESAEVIILQIFENMESFKDLFACARVNQGFYHVFKRHELRLMKNALRNMSPAQWELREASPKEIIWAHRRTGSDYTPTTYIQFHKRDDFVIKALRSLMTTRCVSCLSRGAMKALLGADEVRLKRIDDALWRIWTFCTIFGADRGREFDIYSQMDWLRGQRPAEVTKTTSRSSNDNRRQAKIREAQEAESFGRGNYGGLTIDELNDITEAWTCIKHLTKGISGPGRCIQAQGHGVFNKLASQTADLTAEVLLDEWIYYLRALGLSTIVDLAHYTNSPSDEVFTVAECMEWVTWNPPAPGQTRRHFLQEPVQRLLDEMTGEAKQVTFEQVQEQRKSIGLELAAELREEKEQSLKSRDTLYLHDDQSVSLWLAWMTRAESTSTTARSDDMLRHAANNEDETVQPVVPAVPTVPVAPVEKPVEPETRPVVREQRSNSTLSIFPPQYTRSTPNATPRASPVSTPMRSRNNSRSNSIVQADAFIMKPDLQAPSAQEAPQTPDKEIREQKHKMPFSPRLSVCPEI